MGVFGQSLCLFAPHFYSNVNVIATSLSHTIGRLQTDLECHRNEWIFNHTNAGSPAVVRLTVSGVGAMERCTQNITLTWIRDSQASPLPSLCGLMPGTRARRGLRWLLLLFNPLSRKYVTLSRNLMYSFVIRDTKFPLFSSHQARFSNSIWSNFRFLFFEF